MTCPICNRSRGLPSTTLMRVKGEDQTVVARLSVVQEIGGERTKPVLIVGVHKKGTAPPKQPLTEAEAEQP